MKLKLGFLTPEEQVLLVEFLRDKTDELEREEREQTECDDEECAARYRRELRMMRT